MTEWTGLKTSAQTMCLGGACGGGEACRRLGGAVGKSALQEEQSPGRKIPADLEVFGEKEYFYKKKDAQ